MSAANPERLNPERPNDRTTAQVLQFRLQYMAVMMMAGRAEDADVAFNQALELVQDLIDDGH